MREMSSAETRRFLSEGTRTGKVAVVRADGAPLVVPVWFVLDDDGAVVFMTGADTVKGRALRRDGRVSLCVDREEPPYDFVRVDGTVTLDDDPAVMLPWSIRIAERYMGAEQAEAYGRRNAVPGELLVRVTPTRLVAQADIAG